MKEQENLVAASAIELRKYAEKKLLKQKSAEGFVEVDYQKLLHELQVHQIELEMQNEELKIAKEVAESASEKYVDLYDFAPFGYLTLSEKGSIVDLNFSAARILDNDRIHLKNKRFGLYVLHESLKSFNNLMTEAFEFHKRVSCELMLLSKNGGLLYVLIGAQVSQNTKMCLITMIDISERKAMEVQLQKALHQYKELNSYFLGREIRMVELKKEINELLIKSGCEKEYLI